MLKVMKMMESKTHIVSIKVGGKEFVVGTDNISELLKLPLFSDLFGSSSVGGVAVKENSEDVAAYKNVVEEQQRTIKQLQEQLGQLQEVVRAQQQPQRQEQSSQQAQQMQQQAQQMQQQAQQMQQQAQVQRMHPLRQQLQQQSPLEVPPDKMNEQIWGSMTEEQQKQWMQKWVV